MATPSSRGIARSAGRRPVLAEDGALVTCAPDAGRTAAARRHLTRRPAPAELAHRSALRALPLELLLRPEPSVVHPWQRLRRAPVPQALRRGAWREGGRNGQSGTAAGRGRRRGEVARRA